MKKLVSLVLVLGLVLMMSCSAMAADYSVAVIMKADNTAAYWAAIEAGCARSAEMMDVTVTVNGPANETEVEAQVALIADAIAAGADALVIAPLDDAAVSAALEGYEGVVVFMDTDCTYEGKTSFVGTDNVAAAKDGAVYGFSANDVETKALIVYGQENDTTSLKRVEGYEQVLYMNNLEPVAEVSGNNNTADSEAAVAAVLADHPEINLILCHNDDTAIGALNAVKAAGLENVTVMGFDGNADALALVESGELYGTVAQEPDYIGYIAVQTAALALDGQKVASNVYVNTEVIGNN